MTDLQRMILQERWDMLLLEGFNKDRYITDLIAELMKADKPYKELALDKRTPLIKEFLSLNLARFPNENQILMRVRQLMGTRCPNLLCCMLAGHTVLDVYKSLDNFVWKDSRRVKRKSRMKSNRLFIKPRGRDKRTHWNVVK